MHCCVSIPTARVPLAPSQGEKQNDRPPPRVESFTCFQADRLRENSGGFQQSSYDRERFLPVEFHAEILRFTEVWERPVSMRIKMFYRTEQNQTKAQRKPYLNLTSRCPHTNLPGKKKKKQRRSIPIVVTPQRGGWPRTRRQSSRSSSIREFGRATSNSGPWKPPRL